MSELVAQEATFRHAGYDPATPWINPDYRVSRTKGICGGRWVDRDMLEVTNPEYLAALASVDPL